MPKAENKEQFRSVWREHITQLRLLAQSLPLGEVALDYLRRVKELEPFVEIAVKHVYPEEQPEQDATEDLPAHEEARRDYGTEKGEPV